MSDSGPPPPFPAQLRNWSGHRSGGVRRLFDDASGRPGEVVFNTSLLARLRGWAAAHANRTPSTPRLVLLVGGPGNGKTEAIESTIRWLDEELGSDARLVEQLRPQYNPPDGLVPRVAQASLGSGRSLVIVQDATTVIAPETRTAAQLLLAELEVALAQPSEAYLCCVNRGVLDDALVEAIDTGATEVCALLEAVTRAVGLFPDASACWPLDKFPEVNVWPMDAESLLLPAEEGGEPPAASLFNAALEARKWPAQGTCPAGAWCPFCNSREQLSREREQASLLRMLRWYEVASGKRWSFRDLFSLASYLLAGGHADQGSNSSPCEWARDLIARDEVAKRKGKPTQASSTAIFHLASAQYQHALFHSWPHDAGPRLLRDLKDLALDDDNTAMGLAWFLQGRRAQYLPTVISSALEGVVEIMDPGLASPDVKVQATLRTTFWLRDIDVRFSRSVSEGLDYVRRQQVLSKVEVELLDRLSALDAELSRPAVRRKRPAVATRVQRLVRDFACRLVRRALGARTASVRDANLLDEFQRVLEDASGDELYDVALDVEKLLNNNQEFEISLTTTFGQPLPPPMHRATLVVPARPVRAYDAVALNRPKTPIAFLRVGQGASAKSIALTYELFRAVKELKRGLSPASLPRTVLALLDTTRARLSGPIVRDRQILERASIKIGEGGITVGERRQGFAARKEEPGR